MDTSPPTDPLLGLPDLSPEAARALPEGVRRQVARYLLRWNEGARALALLPENPRGPRDRFERCSALLAAGRTDEARELAKRLVNEADCGNWGHRAVGEVFLAFGNGNRADERFRAGGDPVGRARAHLLLGDAVRALELLEAAAPDDPEAEATRLAALRARGSDAPDAEQHLAELLARERAEVLEALGGGVSLNGQFPHRRLPGTEAELVEALQQVFGYSGFRPGQTDMILPLLRGESVLGLLPTGAGKSLCFQLPAAFVSGATVVISPLIALMKDQVDGLPPALYRRATLINSSLEPGEAERRLQLVAEGEVSLIYAAPERLRQRGFVRALQRRGVSLFVVDEAHCVSLWGHDFRPDYFFIRRVLRDLDHPTVLALTATATPEMQEEIGRQLDVRFRPVNLGTFRPNLHLEVHRLSAETEKWTHLLRLVQEERGATIVYVDRRKLAEELAERLRQEGIAAAPYHAGMVREARDATQTRFMLGELRVIVATVAFGMGVDKADVRLVAHFNLPRSLEAYYQEAGRAGRDGLPARCVLLYTAYDRSNLTRRSGMDRPQVGDVLAIHRVLARLLKPGGGPLTVEQVERDSGANPIRVRVMISLLESLGALERGYDLPGSIWLAAPHTSGLSPDEGGPVLPDEAFRRLLAGLEAELRAGVVRPTDQLARAAALPVDELEVALLDWQEAGWIRFRGGDRGMAVHLHASADLPVRVAQALGRMAELDRRRLDLLSTYLSSADCRQAFVSRYFGRELDQGCGGCDNCRQLPTIRTGGQPPASAPGRAAAEAPMSGEESAVFERLRAWRREKAREEGVPAYVIFHDRVLYGVARTRPRTLPALAEVPGLSSAKVRAYGNEILALVRE